MKPYSAFRYSVDVDGADVVVVVETEVVVVVVPVEPEELLLEVTVEFAPEALVVVSPGDLFPEHPKRRTPASPSPMRRRGRGHV